MTAPLPPAVTPGGDGGQRTTARSRRRVTPGPRLVVGSVMLVLLISMLLVEAYVSARFAGDEAGHADGNNRTVPAEVLTGGPVINVAGPQVRSHRLPQRTIALTFDDGPDPWWTPQILRVLQENDVDATFFVVGSQVARHPDIVRRTVAEGHELGVHTFTHPRLTALSPWRRRLEYSHTQMVIARAAHVRTALLRFPYSSRADAMDDATWPLVREAGELGYLVVVNDIDSRDWAKPGTDQIVRSATPAGGAGVVVLMHDGGGDRTETVAALRRFIPLMKARGYRFTTVSEGLNLTFGPRPTAGTAPRGPLARNPPAADADAWRGGALAWTLAIARGTVRGLTVLFVVVGVLTIGRTALMLLLARRNVRRRRAVDWFWGPPVTDPVSVVVPAFNEKEGIEAAVRSLAGGDHPEIEVVVVDDGSTDNTAALARGLRLPNVRVVSIPNGGKPNALNTGVALASHELIVMVDGDTVFEPESIRRLVQPFADPAVGAVAGNVKVGNRGGLLGRWQHIEYVIGFNLDRRLYEELRCMPTVPGAIGAFRRSALRGVGGMSDATLAEDTDVTMALCRAGWRVVYEESARAWTEAPTTLAQLYQQRYRWSYGTMQAMWKHRAALRHTGHSGRFGRRGLPFLALFGVALPLLAPLVDVLTLYGLVLVGRRETIVAWLVMLALQLFTAVVAFRLDQESLRPLWSLPLQQFVYRQLMYRVLVQSAVTALAGRRLRWHKLHRTGLATAPGPVGEAERAAPAPAPAPGPPAGGPVPPAVGPVAAAVGPVPPAGGPVAAAVGPVPPAVEAAPSAAVKLVLRSAVEPVRSARAPRGLSPQGGAGAGRDSCSADTAAR